MNKVDNSVIQRKYGEKNMSFANLKSRSADISKLVQAAETAGGSTQKSYADDRFWKPEVDKSGNGYAIIRFLPEPANEDLPWVRMFDHGFQGPGGWYIENSLTTINQNDPVGEYNSQLWNNGTDAGKEQARKQKRRLSYYSNIYVVKDPANPANEGKVFLYKYGKKIWDKLNEAMSPEFEDENPINPFDFWEGADFKLKIRNVDGYRNYDRSEFDSPAALLDGDDEQLESVYNSMHSLQEFLDPSNFKSYDELKAKLDRVLNGGKTASAAASLAEEFEVEEEVTPAPRMAAKPAPAMASSNDSFDDDDLSFFEKLAEED